MTITTDALTLVAHARADALRARRLLDRPVPASAAHRRRAGDILARASERLRQALETPGLTAAAARRLADVRDTIDAHLLAAGDVGDELLAAHQHRLFVRAADLVVARADATLLRRAG